MYVGLSCIDLRAKFIVEKVVPQRCETSEIDGDKVTPALYQEQR